MLKLFIVAAVFLLSIVAVYAACTYQVGDPNITLDCVEVVLGNSHVMYCDAGGSTQTSVPPRDAGDRDSRE